MVDGLSSPFCCFLARRPPSSDGAAGKTWMALAVTVYAGLIRFVFLHPRGLACAWQKPGNWPVPVGCTHHMQWRAGLTRYRGIRFYKQVVLEPRKPPSLPGA